jgi:Lrp/AsnC family leucine-responsive transcriptional regulator
VLVVFAPSMDAYHMLVRQLLEGPPSARNVKTYFSQHRAKFDPRVPVS